MGLYAGFCATDITPPPGAWMSGYAYRSTGATGTHDPLTARVVAADDGHIRVVLVSLDLIAMPQHMVADLRQRIAAATGAAPSAVMLHCTHTHGGPCVLPYRCMGDPDGSWTDVFARKVAGAAGQATASMRPVRATYGEAAAQIGVNRRQTNRAGDTVIHTDFGGVVAPLVQTLCLSELGGRTLAMLFCHACHPTTMGGDNLQWTADWPGAAAAALAERFRTAGADSGIAADALAVPLTGCAGDINPHPRGAWTHVEQHGRTVADAAHAARWSSRVLDDPGLSADERTVELPLQPPPSVAECDAEIAAQEARAAELRASGGPVGQILHAEGFAAWARDAKAIAERGKAGTCAFTIQRLTIGGVQIIGFPGEMFVRYQLDFQAQCKDPVLALGYTNGCHNYVPTAAEYSRGGYEVDGAHRYYGTQMFTADCEPLIRSAAYELLGVAHPNREPYPLITGRSG